MERPPIEKIAQPWRAYIDDEGEVDDILTVCDYALDLENRIADLEEKVKALTTPRPIAKEYWEYQATEAKLDDALMAAFGADPDKPDEWPAGDFGYDPYDNSFELWGARLGWAPTVEQINTVMDLGFACGWICYNDGTERYCKRDYVGGLKQSTRTGGDEKRIERQHRRQLSAAQASAAEAFLEGARVAFNQSDIHPDVRDALMENVKAALMKRTAPEPAGEETR